MRPRSCGSCRSSAPSMKRIWRNAAICASTLTTAWLLMAAPGVGATVGSLLLASVNKFRVGTRSICACVLGFALFLTLFAFSHWFLLSILALTMIGFCQLGERALTNTAIQMGT